MMVLPALLQVRVGPVGLSLLFIAGSLQFFLASWAIQAREHLLMPCLESYSDSYYYLVYIM